MRMAMLLVIGVLAYVQKQELGLTLGGLLSQERSFPGGTLTSGGGTAFQVNYGLRVKGWDTVALLFEAHFLANPLREVTSTIVSVTQDYATLYITPGVYTPSPNYNVTGPAGWQHNVVIGGGFVVRFGE